MQIRNTKETEHRCEQTRCAFFVQGGCRECLNCNSPAFIMLDSCKKCFECEHEDGELRWEGGQKKIGAKNKEKLDTQQKQIKVFVVAGGQE